jgi:mono/diheme cytochrome c family protein/streptogramin lyase
MSTGHYRGLVTTLALLCGWLTVEPVPAASQHTTAGDQRRGFVDRFQRTYEVLGNNEVAASGPARGETIYFYKCWMCHNQGARKGDKSGLVGPSLTGVVTRLKTNEAVAAKINGGGPRMPAFRHTLSDADLTDLVSYLATPTCCYENSEPPRNPHYVADTKPWPVPSSVKGGARGRVRMKNGYPLEGVKVQLIAPNAVRTTVFSDADGRYEFPVLQAGSYTLRIATPAPYQPYVREGVQIAGAAALEDIILEPIPKPEGVFLRGALPPTPDVMAQLSGAEWLWNLPGTVEDKATFVKGCGIGCHNYELIFRNRYDERSWALIVERMKTGAQGGPGAEIDESETGTATKSEIQAIAKWLAAVRGPDSHDAPVRPWPSHPSGAATRVVITEYEANRRLLNLHDVCGDAEGNIWYSSHHSPYVGYLDPKTGIIREYKLPPLDGGVPNIDTHACRVDTRSNVVWFSQGPPQPGQRAIFKLDIGTGRVQQFPAAFFMNFGVASDGFLWGDRINNGRTETIRVSPENGGVANAWPRTGLRSYQTIVTDDGRFAAGGASGSAGTNGAWMLDTRSGKMYETYAYDFDHAAGRGEFDAQNNAWFGGRGGAIIELVNEIPQGKGIRARFFWPPTPMFPFSDFYTVMPDKNGEIWGTVMHGRGFLRFNPKTERWVVYENPEPSALNRFEWVDNSTTPPTIWYPDFLTQMFVRIQPLE